MASCSLLRSGLKGQEVLGSSSCLEEWVISNTDGKKTPKTKHYLWQTIPDSPLIDIKYHHVTGHRVQLSGVTSSHSLTQQTSGDLYKVIIKAFQRAFLCHKEHFSKDFKLKTTSDLLQLVWNHQWPKYWGKLQTTFWRISDLMRGCPWELFIYSRILGSGL